MRSVPMSWIEANRIALFRGPQVISWKVGSSSYGGALIELEGAFVRVSYQVRDSEESSWKRVSVLAETMEQPCQRVCNFLWAARSRLIDVGGDSVTK